MPNIWVATPCHGYVTLGEKWTVVIWKLKKGTDLIFTSGWRGWGKGKKADLWMGKMGEAMKTEEINQWYHLHGSLANHRTQRFISLWVSSYCSCCHNKPNPPNHHAYTLPHKDTHTLTQRSHIRLTSPSPSNKHRVIKSPTLLCLCVFVCIHACMYSRYILSAYCPSLCVYSICFIYCVCRVRKWNHGNNVSVMCFCHFIETLSSSEDHSTQYRS